MNKKQLYLSPVLLDHLFGDIGVCQQYRYIKKFEQLGILYAPKNIGDIKGWTWSFKQGISRTFQVNLNALKKDDLSLKPAEVKKEKEFGIYTPEFRYTCYELDNYFKYKSKPADMMQVLFNERLKIKQVPTLDEKANKNKIDSFIKKLPNNFLGQVGCLDQKYFIKDGQVDRNLYAYFLRELRKKCIKIPKNYQEEIDDYNTNISNKQFKIIFRPRITINFTKTRLYVSSYCRAISEFCLSHKETRTDILSYSGLSHLKTNYDITAAAPSVVRLFNRGIWDEASDPRINIVNNSDLPNFDLKRLKKLTFQMVFSKSENSAWNNYNTFRTSGTRYKKIDRFVEKYGDILENSKNIIYDYKHNMIDLNQQLDEKSFRKLYAEMIKEIGKPFGVKAFFYESLIEIEALTQLQNKGYTAVNIYDNIYSDASLKEVQDVIKSSAFKIKSKFSS